LKSAYELAMERLERDQGPTRKLTDEQRERIAEIDKRYDAQIAEARLNHEQRLAGAPPESQESVRAELVDTLQSIEDRRRKEKESVWASEGAE